MAAVDDVSIQVRFATPAPLTVCHTRCVAEHVQRFAPQPKHEKKVEAQPVVQAKDTLIIEDDDDEYPLTQVSERKQDARTFKEQLDIAKHFYREGLLHSR